MRRLSGNLFFCHLAFLNYCELFFFNGQTFIILGEGRGYYDMGHVLLLFLTKITSFRHIPSTENCVETDYNIYYSDSKDRDRLESYFRSNSILLLAVLFPKPQYRMAPTWRYKALVLLSYFLGNVLCASALKQLDGKSNEMFSKSSRTIKSSVGSSGPSSSNDFSWLTSILSLFYPGVTFEVDDGCGWTTADAGKNLYEGDCGDSVFLENTSNDDWCTITYSTYGVSGSASICLANGEADCCEIAPGPTAGIAIVLILLLAGIIACICRCCRCFCFKSKSEAPQVVVVQAPAATASEK